MYNKRNNILDVILLYLSDYNTSYYLRQISVLTKIPLKTCQNILNFLEKDKVLKSKVEGKNKYFSLNLDNIYTKSFLLQAEIYKMDIFLSKYPETKLFLKSLHTNVPIILFGSYAKFQTNKDSDFDIFIVSKSEIKLPYHLLPCKVHEIKLSEKSFIEALKNQEAIIKEVEKNHITLNNHSFYVNTMWRIYGK